MERWGKRKRERGEQREREEGREGEERVSSFIGHGSGVAARAIGAPHVLYEGPQTSEGPQENTGRLCRGGLCFICTVREVAEPQVRAGGEIQYHRSCGPRERPVPAQAGTVHAEHSRRV